MATYRTPDVYVEEISLLPPSVAEVGTAIPAFIGYTQTAMRGNQSLANKPTKIYSLKEYEALFGMPPADAVTVTLKEVREGGTNTGTLQGYTATGFTPADGSLPSFLLYWAVKMYFDNGGAQCYVVSVGAPYPAAVLASDLERGLDALELEDEPTLIVVPEAIKLGTSAYGAAVQAVLLQCGDLKDRFAIIDVRGGNTVTTDVVADVDAVRGLWGTNNLKYGAAYYPFVKTSMNFYVDETASNVTVTINRPDNTAARTAVALSVLENGSPADPTATPPVAAVAADTAAFNAAKMHITNFFLGMPPSGAVAGVYAATDAARGVWKAPANVSLADVIEPMVKIDNLKQDSLNIDTNGGKSVNAIRAFAGKGTLVWGARTLAGNDNEWRYVSVRRFFNMVEESVKKSTHWAVFEPNDANTWVKVRGMIENYLTDKWRDGALAGATPKDAFFVKCGLGVTMTSQDILQGRMNVEIGMAVVRPAEFIVLKFSHKMQTS
jgi:uncharacterized protein